MPFTLAHTAAALPFRRSRLVTSALVVGTIAPDFEYFVRLTPRDRYGHTIVGALLLTLPIALAVLWIFHAYVKHPVVALMPAGVRTRLSIYLGEFRFGGPARFALIVTSILLGIATHLLWDSFTHGGTWADRQWRFLRQPVHLPMVGMVPNFKILQHASTVVGLTILAIWLAHWYRTSTPSSKPLGQPMTWKRRVGVVGTISVVALVGALIRAAVGPEIEASHFSYSKFTGEMVATFVALFWWQLVAYGIVLSKSGSDEI